MKGVKNLKVLGASLCLSAVLLTGCTEERIHVGTSDIICEEGKTTGNISYEDVDTNLRIVSFEQEEKISNILLISQCQTHTYNSDNNFKHYTYHDLKTGACVLDYYDFYDKNEIQYKIGESLSIVEEEYITPYLVTENFIQKEYTAEELVTFFEEKVVPTLENNNKELIK